MTKLEKFPEITEEKQPKLPKDLGIKIGSKEEAAWTSAKEKTELEIRQDKMAIILNEAILVKIEEMIKKEKGLNTSKK